MGYCIAQTSLAHTYGNVTCFILEYIRSLFPKDYFKTIHISSKIAYREFDIFKNTNKEFIRKNKPMLIIRPRLEMDASDLFLEGTFLTKRIDDNYADIDFSNLQDFIFDPETGGEMKYLLNRIRVLFDVVIISETQIDQINQAFFLRNRVRQDIPFFLSTALESYIPHEMMELMAEDMGIPLYDENGSVKRFLDYVNSVSIYPVSYKMKNSSGNDEFFRFYPVNIDTMFAGLNIDDGSKRGMVSDSYTISFTVSTEFNSAGLYYYFSRKPDKIDGMVIGIEAKKEGSIIPIYTINNLYTERLADGWNVYAAPMYGVDASCSRYNPDVMDIKPLLNNSILKCINYHKENGIPINTFMQIVIMRDNKMLVPERDYEVDFNTYKLITKAININSTYRLIIHINTFYINSLIKDLLDLEKEK